MICTGCEHLKTEQWPRGCTAVRCMAQLPPPWGNGRVLTSFPGEVVMRCVQRPCWCPKGN